MKQTNPLGIYEGKKLSKTTSVVICCFCLYSLFNLPAVAGEPHFVECKYSMDKPDFRALAEYLESNPEALRPDECLRLNDHQILATVTYTSPGGQGLYIYDADKNAFEEYENIPGIEVAKEFGGQDGQRYVLLTGERLLHGICNQSYNILQFETNQKSRRDSVQHRATSQSATANPNGNGAAHKKAHRVSQLPIDVYNLFFISLGADCAGCEGYAENEAAALSQGINVSPWAVAFKVTGYHIFNEGSDHLEIVFDLREQDCKSLKSKNYKKKFSFKNGRFAEVITGTKP